MRAATASGGSGAGVLYNDWDSGDDAKEFRALIVTPPASGTFTANEDGSFSLVGAADGSYSYTYRLFLDGVDQGTAVATLTVGAGSSFSIAPAGIACSVGIGSPSFARHVDFAVSPAGLASTVGYGTPSFVAVREFAIAPSGLAVSIGLGSPTLSFAIPDPGEPVTLDEAKLAARVDGAELDPFILGVIAAARAQAEQITGRVYRQRHFRFELEDWPEDGHRFTVHEPTACEVSYWNGTGWQQLVGSAFEFDGIGSAAEIAPALDTSWPALARKAVGARVKVDFTAGPASRDNVDEAVKLFIKAHVAAWVDNPQALSSKQVELSPLLNHLLDEQRLWS